MGFNPATERMVVLVNTGVGTDVDITTLGLNQKGRTLILDMEFAQSIENIYSNNPL